MKLTVQPGKRVGLPKKIFDRQLNRADVNTTHTGDVTLTIVADDIYTPKASRRFSMTFSQPEMDMIQEAMRLA